MESTIDRQRRQTLELTRAQTEQWMAVEPADGSAGNVAHCVELLGAIDFQTLAEACDHEFAASGVGLTRFLEQEGHPYQWLSPSLDGGLWWVDLTSEADPVAAAYSWMHGDWTAPLAMVRNPLALWALIKVGPERYFWYLRSHHAVVDGYGGLGLTARIAERYSAKMQGREPAPYRGHSLPELVALEREYTSSEDFELDRMYWTDRLSGLEIATDHLAAGPSGMSEHRAHDELSSALTTQLDEVARAVGTSVARVLTAALCGFESAVSGQGTGVVALAVAGRRTTALKLSGGMVSNAIPIALDCGYPVTRDGLIDAAITEVTTGLVHSRYRFEDIRRDAGALTRRLDVFGPTVNFLFFDNAVRLGSAVGRHRILTSGCTEHLHFDIYRSGSESALSINLIGNSAFFTAVGIQERLDRFMRYLQEFVYASGDTPLGNIGTLDDIERGSLLAWGDGGELASPQAVRGETSLAVIFEKRTVSCVDKVAIRSGERSWTYQEFASKVNRLARYLIELGVGPDTPVAVATVRSVDMLVGMYAVIVAGGAYLPVDPAAPAARNSHTVEVAAPVLVLKTSQAPNVQGLPASLPAIEIDRVDLSRFSGDPVRDADRRFSLQPGHIAYIIFTSGSTGRPKGVMVDHAAVAAHLGWMQERYPLGPTDVVLHKTPAGFDVSVWEMLWPILFGARLVIAAQDRHTDYAYLETLIRSEQITIAHFVPSVLAAFVMETSLSDCSSLRSIVSSGEVLPADLAMRVREAGIEMHNLYGPTETTIDVTSHQVSSTDTLTVPIGRPVTNTRVFVLDGWLRPVPVGVPGELYIAGVQLARGYINRPTLTAGRFVACPLVAGERMYRTGDVVRWNASGCLDYLGRNDFQLKIHGVRIEPGEIETVLTDHPAVDSAVVVESSDGSTKDPKLVGYIVASEDFGPAHEQDTVLRWRDVYNELYSSGSQHHSPTDCRGFEDDFSGWDSSYTGDPIPLGQMREWRDMTVRRIRELNPRRVLEIGVGSGLILSQMAPQCEVYCGSDLSPVTVKNLEERLRNVNDGWVSRVQLTVGSANQLDEYAIGYFDTIVLNSVIQYFPSASYLRNVIKDALRLLSPGGALFLGDVRSLRYLEELETGVELAQGGVGGADDVRRCVRRRLSNQHELLVEPDFFAGIRRAFPGEIEHDIQLKRGSSINELTRYRYDVVLHKMPKSIISVKDSPTIGFSGLSSVRAVLADHRLESVRVADVPHRGLLTEIRAVEELVQSGNGDVHGLADGLLPEDLHAVAADCGYACTVTWSARRGCMEAVFVRTSVRSGRCIVDTYVPIVPGRPVEPSSNRPMVSVLVDEVREFAAARLPEYMTPSMIVVLDQWPLTVSGKLDRAGLPVPVLAQNKYRAPASGTECALSGILAAVLGVERVGVDDDFFSLGGDSILSTQVAVRARRCGIVLTSREVLDRRTVKRLAQLMTDRVAAPAGGEIAGSGVGEMELSPVARWLMDMGTTGCRRFHLSTLLRMPSGIDRQSLVTVLEAVVDRHDMLRGRLCRKAVGSGSEWCMVTSAVGTVDVGALLTRVEVDAEQGVPVDAWEAAVSELDPYSGVVMRAIWLDRGPDRVGDLLLVVHHLVFDGVSSRIVIEDLAEAWSDVKAGRPLAKVSGSTSMRTWMEVLQSDANSESRVAELPMWQSMIEGPDPLPGVRALDPTVDTTSTIQRLQAFIDVDRTSALFGYARSASEARIGEMLIAALAVAVARWQAGRGVVLPSVLLRLIGHGREELARADLSSTVGWFNSMYPLRIDLLGSNVSEAAAGSLELAALVLGVAKRIRTIPDSGIGYGLLRYLNQNTAPELPYEMPGRICFNYLGQIQTDDADAGAWSPVVEGLYESMPDPSLPAAVALDITVVVVNGQMIGDFGFPAALFDKEEVQELVELWSSAVLSLAVTAGHS